jgi:serine/threonine-protein kinase
MTETRDYIQFGPYLIVRLSGAGGMGRVEVALRAGEKDPEVCVIKRLHGAARDEESEARFRREAQIAARLEHENIGRTLRIEKIDGELCIVQELIEGVNLGKVMRQLGVRPLPIIVAVHVVSAVARALAYAHGFGRMGIVHRDVTPENIMLSFAGDVKLIDFGTARSAVDGRVTDTGVVVGRRSYVPPEAWEGDKVDQRADVFALGVVLWEVLTGRRAEEAPEPSLPDASALNPEVTLLLGQVVARAMAPAPEDRYQSADEVAAALAAFVPPEADPRRDLADLLGLCFNVALQKRLLDDDLREAKHFLADRDVVPAPASMTDPLFPPPAEEIDPADETAPATEADEPVVATLPIEPPTPSAGDAAGMAAGTAPGIAATMPAGTAPTMAPGTVAGTPTAAVRPRRHARATVPTGRPVAPTVPNQMAAKRRASPGPWMAAGVAAIVATSGIGLLRTHGRSARSRASAASTVVAPQPVVPAQPVAPTPSVAPASPEWPVAPALPESPPEPMAVKPAAPAVRPPANALDRSPRNQPADRLLRQANDLWERGNTPAAYALARQAVAAGAGAPAHVLLGALLINMKNYAAAEPELATAARLDPRNAEARRMLALLDRTAAEHQSK